MEGIGLAVLADVVALGNGRDRRAVGIHLHQTVGVVCDDLKRGAVGGDLRVQRLDLGLQHDVQGAACGSASCAGSTGGGSRGSCRRAGAAAGRQGQSCCGHACRCQKAAARNTTIESHNIFSPLQHRFNLLKRLFQKNAQGVPLPLWSFSHTLVPWPHYTASSAERKGFLPNLHLPKDDFCGLTNNIPNFRFEFCIVFLLNCTHSEHSSDETSVICPLVMHTSAIPLSFIKKTSRRTFWCGGRPRLYFIAIFKNSAYQNGRFAICSLRMLLVH